MTENEYSQNALRTESGCSFGVSPRLEHAIIGIATEAGEMLGTLKKAKFYGNPIDLENLVEEAGDVRWYLALFCDALGITMDMVERRNIAKLQARYPDKWSRQDSDNRNYGKEKQAADDLPANR